MSFLVDANVLSEAVRKAPNTNVLAWIGANQEQLFVSAITLGEIEKGVVRLPPGPRRRGLERWLSDLKTALEGRILDFGPAEASEWARYYEAQRSNGRLLPTLDSMIAATALLHRLSVVSRNVSDFPGVPVVNPWEPA